MLNPYIGYSSKVFLDFHLGSFEALIHCVNLLVSFVKALEKLLVKVINKVVFMNIKYVFYLYIIVFGLHCNADINKAPPSFKHNGKTLVWSDFKKAQYNIIFDVKKKESSVVSEVSFAIYSEGRPIFDLVTPPDDVQIDGVEYLHKEVNTPQKESKVRYIDKVLSPGVYTLKIKHSIQYGVKYEGQSVSAAFFMKDMRDREFLEKYLPANYEYDQFQINVNVDVVGSNKKYELYTNGHFSKKLSDSFQVSYPKYYTSSSIYFHLVPQEKFKQLNFKYKSINGEIFPVQIYSRTRKRNKQFKKRTIRYLKELEKDYGAWPHLQLILYANGKMRGGMEYSGAAVSGWFALGHELQHGYFARSVMPANGNSGWIDEAVASWRDFFHFSRKKPNYKSMNLANHSVYTRKTDKRSYKKGRSFMAFVDHELHELSTKSDKKCLKFFLKIFFNENKFKTVTTNTFLKSLEKYSNRSFTEEFKRYVYGNKEVLIKGVANNPYHPSYSEKEMNEML